MGNTHRGGFRVLLGIFGPIAALCAVLIFLQYIHYRADKKRLEGELFRHQDMVTSMAASRVQSRVHDVVRRLETLGAQVAASSDRTSQMISAEYDELEGAVDGIALFGPDGNKIDSVSSNVDLGLPDNARYEDFFNVPKQTAVTYISPMVKVQGGGEAVFISCPVKAGGAGKFGGVLLAKITRPSFARLCQSSVGLSHSVHLTYFDQQFQQVCMEPLLASPAAPLRLDLMTDTGKTEIISGAGGKGRDVRARVEYLPLMLEGYRWYLYSEMPLDGLDRMVAEDNRSIFMAASLVMLSMVGGGVYVSRVYVSKARAEKEAGRQAVLAAGAGALAAEKDRLLALINTMPDGIMLLDDKGVILDVNKKMKEILGVSGNGTLAEVTKGASGNDLLGPVSEPPERVIGGRTYRIIQAAVRGEAGPHIREVRILRDVTFEKSLEQKKADLVSMITHDVKSPLTAIVGITGWLKDEGASGGLPDEVKSGVETIGDAANRVISLMDNFVFLSSVEGMRKLAKTPVNLNAFLNKALLQFQLEARKKNMKLDYSPAEHSPVVMMDETQMMRAVENLLANAIKYTPEGGNVSVVARRYGDYVTMSVTDDGPGISSKDMSRIFERRFRGQSVRHVPKGSGLGLSIVRAVVEAHGGAVDVASEEGKGATFTIRLPISAVS